MTAFDKHGPQCEQIYNFYIWGGGGVAGAFNYQTILSPISIYEQNSLNLIAPPLVDATVVDWDPSPHK